MELEDCLELLEEQQEATSRNGRQGREILSVFRDACYDERAKELLCLSDLHRMAMQVDK